MLAGGPGPRDHWWRGHQEPFRLGPPRSAFMASSKTSFSPDRKNLFRAALRARYFRLRYVLEGGLIFKDSGGVSARSKRVSDEYPHLPPDRANSREALYNATPSKLAKPGRGFRGVDLRFTGGC